MEERSNLFLAIDANAIIHRAYHAFPATLTNAEGMQVNAVYGFASMLLRVLDEFKPKYIACAFDTAKPTFRHTQYVDYKAHRKPTEHELIAQFPMVEELVSAFNIPILKREGYEADDVLGSLAKCAGEGKWQDYGLEMVVVTGDRDLLQLINGNIRVCLPAGSFKNLSVYDRDLMHEKYGLYPEQLIDYKGMVGDTSDNIPGVKGIGDKTALDLLQKYGSMDQIYKHLTELKPRVQKLLGEGIEVAELSRSLATIMRDVDVIPDLEAALFKDFDRSKVVELFKKMEFRSLMDKIPDNGEKAVVEDGQISLFGGEKEGDSVLKADSGIEIGSSSSTIVDWSDSGVVKNFMKSLKSAAELRFIYVSAEESVSKVEFIAVGIVDNSGELSSYTFNELGEVFKACFTESSKCETYIYNWEGFVSRVVSSGIGIEDIFTKHYDIRLLSHLTSAGQKSYEFNELVYKHCGKSISKLLSVNEAGSYLQLMGEINKAVIEKLEEIANDKSVKEFIKKVESAEIDNGLKEYLSESENKTSVALAKMENKGLLLDLKKLNAIKDELAELIAECEKNIYDAVGHEFNINSPKQLAEILYDELQLPAGRGKTGRTTQESKLNQLRALHPVVSNILSYRELSKLQNTYVYPFLESVKPAVDKGGLPIIRTDFNQMGASSGRFSSNNPNMQNLPARGEWATRFREVFVAREGYKMVSIDYSQIDLRVMAHVSNDEALSQDFRDEKDIHLETAARIFNKKHELITSDERGFGKTINFGILYGQTKYGLSRMLGISNDDAEKYIRIYFENYKGVAHYVGQATVVAQEKGFVQTLMGRRRYIAGLNSQNRQVREAAVREAINMPIQGGSADVMKLAMLAVYDLIVDKYDGVVFPLLQIHDELIFEAKENKCEAFVKDACFVMENVVKLNVPLKVSAGSGYSMAEIK